MKCPNCLKDIPDGISFCGLCGHSLTGQIEETNPSEDVTASEQAQEVFSEGTEQSEAVTEDAEAVEKTKKKHMGLKLLLIFSIAAVLIGATFGFLTAKGVVDFSSGSDFEWTDRSKGYTEEPLEENSDEDDKKKEEETSSENAESVEQEESSSENQESGETEPGLEV